MRARTKGLYLAVAIASSGMFAGCASPEELKLSRDFEGQGYRKVALQKSDKVEIYRNGEVETRLIASYLNGGTSSLQAVNEKFVIGLYRTQNAEYDEVELIEAMRMQVSLPNDEKRLSTSDRKLLEAYNKEWGHAVEAKEIRINAKPISIHRLASDAAILQHLFLTNSWTDYFYVEFPHSHGKLLRVVVRTLEDEPQTKVLNFTKNAKYLTTKPRY
jgi:hypothetical protein